MELSDAKAAIIAAIIGAVALVISALPSLISLTLHPNINTEFQTNRTDAHQAEFAFKNLGNAAATTLRITVGASPRTITYHVIFSSEAYTNSSIGRTFFEVTFPRFSSNAHATIETSINSIAGSGNYTVDMNSDQGGAPTLTFPLGSTSVPGKSFDLLNFVFNIPILIIAIVAIFVAAFLGFMIGSRIKKAKRITEEVKKMHIENWSKDNITNVIRTKYNPDEDTIRSVFERLNLEGNQD